MAMMMELAVIRCLGVLFPWALLQHLGLLGLDSVSGAVHDAIDGSIVSAIDCQNVRRGEDLRGGSFFILLFHWVVLPGRQSVALFLY